MSLQITLQNRTMIVAADSTVGNLAAVHYPHADILIVNGYPVPASYPLTNGDEVLCIRRGEIPSADDLSCLMAARHTPGVHQRLQAATIGIDRQVAARRDAAVRHKRTAFAFLAKAQIF